MSKQINASDAIKTCKQFIGPAQMGVMREGLRGEECLYFQGKFMEYGERIANMPATYQEGGKGGHAVVFLHYFTSGADWHITEKDIDSDGEGQHQAFGQADLGYGPELGYISIVELLANGAELDLHWKPKTLNEVNGKKPVPSGFISDETWSQ